ncbi:hypothetical protein D3C86_1003380 [compost metagenome]
MDVDHGGDAEFPRHDGGVRQEAASLHHHGARAQEQRGPGGIGRRRHQDAAGGHGQALVWRAGNECAPLGASARYRGAAPGVGGIGGCLRARFGRRRAFLRFSLRVFPRFFLRILLRIFGDHIGVRQGGPRRQLLASGRRAPAQGGGRQPAIGQREYLGGVQMEDVFGRDQPAGATGAAAQFQRALARDGQVGHQHAAGGFALIAFEAGRGQQLGGQHPLPEGQGAADALPRLPRGGVLAGAQRGGIGADQVQHAVQQVGGRFAPTRIAQIGFIDGAVAVAVQEGGEGLPEGAALRQCVRPAGAVAVRRAQPCQRLCIVLGKLRQRHERIALRRGDAGFAARHQRGGQRVSFAGHGLFHQFQQLGERAAARALQKEQVVGGQHRLELLAQAGAERRIGVGQGRVQPVLRAGQQHGQVGGGLPAQGRGPAQIAQDAQAVPQALGGGQRRHADLGLGAAQQRIHVAGLDAQRVVADPLYDGGVEVGAALEQRRQPHAGQGGVAAEFKAAGQHALGHDAAGVPFQRRHGLRQDLAGVAARPVVGLCLQCGIGVARRRCYRPGLHDPELLSVPGPFDVVACACVVQRTGRVADDIAQRLGLRTGQHGLGCTRGGRFGQPGALAVRGGQRGVALGADPLRRKRPGLAQVVFAQAVFVAVRLSVDQGFSQAPVGVDKHLVVAARRGVDGEGDARGCRVDHRHHHHGHAAVGGKTQALPVGLRLWRPQGIPDALHGLQGRAVPAHIQAGQVDAGERGAGGVLLGRR